MKQLSSAALSLWAKKGDPAGGLWLPLAMHMADCAQMSKKLWNHWLPEGTKNAIAEEYPRPDLIEQLLIFLAAAHDIGKATPVFQSKNAAFPPGDIDARIEENLIACGLPMKSQQYFSSSSKSPHALATQLLLQRAGLCTEIAVILGAHHGKPPNDNDLDEKRIGSYPDNYYLENMGKTQWTAVQEEMIAYALRLSSFTSLDEIPNPNLKSQVLLSGLVIMVDWLASNANNFSYIRLDDAPDFDAENRAQTAWDKLNLPAVWSAGNAWMYSDLYQERFEFHANDMQQTVLETIKETTQPGIVVIEAPMGNGKTEAALAVAEALADITGRSGLFFALPTQATSDGIFPRIARWIESLNSGVHSIRLAHGKAEFNKEYMQFNRLFEGSTNIDAYEQNQDGLIVHSWFEGSKKSMLADFVVGTIDQLLFMALKQKHLMLRHLGLANKVVIIDECHSYDVYMNRYLGMAIRWLGAYGVPVIVLSATLPAQRRKMVIDAYLNKESSEVCTNAKADPLGKATPAPDECRAWVTNRHYPLITYTDGENICQQEVLHKGVSRTVKLEILENDISSLCKTLEELLSGGGCAGIIVNTVSRAQSVALSLREYFGDDIVHLFHSRFISPDRAEKERVLLLELGNPTRGAARPAKRIIVGTQVLEQSLDYDVDVMITDICPMDLLIQRIGRLHRHKRTRPHKLKAPLCLITGMEGGQFEKGAQLVYGNYLLMRTKAFLPKQITIPGDIPTLVQNVYDKTVCLPAVPANYERVRTEWQEYLKKKEDRADTFRILSPRGAYENIIGWLNIEKAHVDIKGEAAVRDADESIEVLLVCKKNDGTFSFLPWVNNGLKLFPNLVPDEITAGEIARQSVRLPRALCTPWKIAQTIEALEKQTIDNLSAWQQSAWLKGRLFLILDESCTAYLCGYQFKYDRHAGLIYEKEVDKNERKDF